MFERKRFIKCQNTRRSNVQPGTAIHCHAEVSPNCDVVLRWHVTSITRTHTFNSNLCIRRHNIYNVTFKYSNLTRDDWGSGWNTIYRHIYIVIRPKQSLCRQFILKTGALFKQMLMRCKYHAAVFTCQGAACNVYACFINYVYCRHEKAVGAVKLLWLAIKCDFIRD